MIREESLQLASAIAMAPNATFKPTQLLQSLNESSYGAFDYSNNFVQEVKGVTEENAHSFVQTEMAKRLGEIMRDTLENIRDYGVPLAKAVDDATVGLGTTAQVEEKALYNVEYTFVNLDEPFFDSSIFPTTVKNDVLDYTGVDLNKLDTLTFDYPDDDAIKAFIGTNHPELVVILNDPECSLGYVQETLFTLSAMKEKFSHSNGVFDFSQVKVSDIHLLLKGYLLLARMNGSEDPAPWLKGGNLQVYREMVSLLFNGLTLYLINLKKAVLAWRAIGLRVQVGRTASLKVVPNAEARALDVKATVYYTNGVLQSVMDKGYALRDLLTGAFYASIVNNQVVSYMDMLANPSVANDQYQTYLKGFVVTEVSSKRQLFVMEGLKAISKYLLNNEALALRVNEYFASTGNGELYEDWLKRFFFEPLEHSFSAVQSLPAGLEVVADEAGSEPSNERLICILNTRLVPSFMRALNCNLAAEILEATYVEQKDTDNVSSQRERLRVAVINVMVNQLLAAG